MYKIPMDYIIWMQNGIICDLNSYKKNDKRIFNFIKLKINYFSNLNIKNAFFECTNHVSQMLVVCSIIVGSGT